MKLIRSRNKRLYDLIFKILYPKLNNAFNIYSHLTLRERLVLYQLSYGMSNIAEIGSYLGASTCCFAAASVNKKDIKIICIDTWNNHAMTEGNRDTWAEFKINTNKYADLIIPIRGFSTDVVEQVRNISDKIDLLFIDGDHSYDGVKADWEAYRNFLNPGSIIVFHDYGWADGVKKVVDNDVLPLVSSHRRLPNMWWGTLAKKP